MAKYTSQYTGQEIDSGIAKTSAIPSGGTTGQILKKKSNTDYDTEWANESGGGGGTQLDLYTNGVVNLVPSLMGSGNSTTKIKLGTPPTSENDFNYQWTANGYNGETKTFSFLTNGVSAIYIWSNNSYDFSSGTSVKKLSTFNDYGAGFQHPLYFITLANNFVINIIVTGED